MIKKIMKEGKIKNNLKVKMKKMKKKLYLSKSQKPN
jgi:hypothetical protein